MAEELYKDFVEERKKKTEHKEAGREKIAEL